MITLFLGGVRSGKSSFAEKIAFKRGRNDVVYLATAEAGDEEMVERIKKHRESRPAAWKTVEEKYDLKDKFITFKKGQVVLLDCLTLFISNMIIREDLNAKPEKLIKKEVKEIINITLKNKLDLIIVSNIVGSGVVPVSRLGRKFRDTAGRTNQLVAENADQVYLTIAGLPMEIKEIGLKNINKYS